VVMVYLPGPTIVRQPSVDEMKSQVPDHITRVGSIPPGLIPSQQLRSQSV